MTTQKPSKAYVLHEIQKEVEKYNGVLRILEMGCGTGSHLAEVVRTHPHITYVGIEPSAEAVEKARTHMGSRDNVKIINNLAYETESDYKNSFDIVVSMSVLEHVKDLETFLELSVACAKPGGRIIHLYDLGHSLHPSGIKERIQVALCNNQTLKKIISEDKIAQYVDLEFVVEELKKLGAETTIVTYHNNSKNVAHIKADLSMTEEEILQVAEQEIVDANTIADLAARERVFPSVCVWARRAP